MNGEVIDIEGAWQEMEAGTAVYVDVRSTGEFEGGHPQGAYHIPLIEMGPGGRDFNDDFVPAIRALAVSLGGDSAPQLIIACQAGGRSRQACQLLAAEGVATTYDFAGGWGGRPHPFGGQGAVGWAGSGKPTAATADEGRDWPALKAKIG
jgi:rhodanese-related sulfurtransferase